MLTLYYKPSCPFCQDVLGEAEALNVKLQLKDTATNPEYLEELLSLGGKKQVPFLVDTQNGTAFYESSDIIRYIAEQQATQQSTSFKGVRIYKSEDVCDTCQ